MSKGISEIVATLIMIVVVSGVGMALYVYSMGYFTITTSAVRDLSNVDINSVRERFAVVDVILKVGGGGVEVKAAVYNYGKTSVTLKKMFLNGTEVTVAGPLEVMPGGLTWFNGTIPVVLPEKSVFSLRVVSSLGNVYETIVAY